MSLIGLLIVLTALLLGGAVLARHRSRILLRDFGQLKQQAADQRLVIERLQAVANLMQTRSKSDLEGVLAVAQSLQHESRSRLEIARADRELEGLDDPSDRTVGEELEHHQVTLFMAFMDDLSPGGVYSTQTEPTWMRPSVPEWDAHVQKYKGGRVYSLFEHSRALYELVASNYIPHNKDLPDWGAILDEDLVASSSQYRIVRPSHKRRRLSAAK